jgi:hypothetical protein
MKNVSRHSVVLLVNKTLALLPLCMFASSYEYEQNIAELHGMETELSSYSGKFFIETSPYL